MKKTSLGSGCEIQCPLLLRKRTADTLCRMVARKWKPHSSSRHEQGNGGLGWRVDWVDWNSCAGSLKVSWKQACNMTAIIKRPGCAAFNSLHLFNVAFRCNQIESRPSVVQHDSSKRKSTPTNTILILCYQVFSLNIKLFSADINIIQLVNIASKTSSVKYPIQ